jgi:phosphoribosylformylglycinamidine synthase
MPKAEIYVTFKDGVLEPQGKTVKAALEKMGYKNVKDVRIGKFIEMEISDGDKEKIKKEIDEICDKLLANPNIEKYTFKIE